MTKEATGGIDNQPSETVEAGSSAALEEKLKQLQAEINEQKAVINDLIDQLTTKTLEIVDFKKQVEDAFKQAAEAKTSLAQAKFEKVQLEDLIE